MKRNGGFSGLARLMETGTVNAKGMKKWHRKCKTIILVNQKIQLLASGNRKK